MFDAMNKKTMIAFADIMALIDENTFLLYIEMDTTKSWLKEMGLGAESCFDLNKKKCGFIQFFLTTIEKLIKLSINSPGFGSMQVFQRLW